MEHKLSLTVPELAFLAATRGMIGAGVGLLLSNKISRQKRKAIGLPLLIVGALSTIPIARHLFSRNPREVGQ